MNEEFLKQAIAKSNIDDQFERIYKILGLDDEVEDEEGLSVEVRRIDDKKKFTLTLADLKTVEENTKSAQLLDDYAVWHTNFR
ncbi:calcium-binding protein [Desulfosarcina ovata]|uniref:Uncharacterized protein n=1 Tax=Desulfosarcina ovata subsp. ovata TaxID=2752305 RepID=A0A5K8AI43_9BACT|nr:calcium-binding protein [Desulfosarcina ovata]BBO92363.1 hypothetical protein DSCOOX_55430 [Desulfosarcina ovata subsp. ovata]